MIRPGLKHGFPVKDWNQAKKGARAAMIKRAKVRGMISYSDLVAEIKSIKIDAYDHRLFHMLGEISSAEDAAGRGMLTVVVVHKTGDMEPGTGFFELADALGRDTSDRMKCWVEELHKVHAVWSTP
jgi:molybdopterin synthase catalytic subunit